LEQQRQALIEQLKAQGYTNDQIRAMVDGLGALRAQSSAFASSTASRWSKSQATAYAQLNALHNVVDETRTGLSVANRSIQDVGARQREIAVGIREARDRIGTGFARSNDQLGVIARKDFSPSFNATIPVTVNASLSYYNALTIQSRLLQIRLGGGGGNTGGSV
jgi:DNA-binding transcriptional MerR regulator